MTEVPEHADKTGGGETPQDMNQHPTLTEIASPFQAHAAGLRLREGACPCD